MGAIRGRRDPRGTMLAFVDMEERVPKNHPLRAIKAVADESLGASVWEVRPDVLGGGPGDNPTYIFNEPRGGYRMEMSQTLGEVTL